MGLFQGQAGGRIWRRHLSENAPQRGDDPKVLTEALDLVREQQARKSALQETG
jgi:tRNA-dihydrouridine synthase A